MMNRAERVERIEARMVKITERYGGSISENEDILAEHGRLEKEMYDLVFYGDN